MNFAEMVKDFHRMTDLPIGDGGDYHISKKEALERINLILEELHEYQTAVLNDDIIGQADGLTDLLYVVLGAMVVHGFPIDKLFLEVHNSNMTKKDGVLDKSTGKFIKPSNYIAPNISGILYESSL